MEVIFSITKLGFLTLEYFYHILNMTSWFEITYPCSFEDQTIDSSMKKKITKEALLEN